MLRILGINRGDLADLIVSKEVLAGADSGSSRCWLPIAASTITINTRVCRLIVVAGVLAGGVRGERRFFPQLAR